MVAIANACTQHTLIVNCSKYDRFLYLIPLPQVDIYFNSSHICDWIISPSHSLMGVYKRSKALGDSEVVDSLHHIILACSCESCIEERQIEKLSKAKLATQLMLVRSQVIAMLCMHVLLSVGCCI